MALVPVVGPADGSLVELEDIGGSAESLGRVLESQKSLFHSQVEQLQKLVVTQCKLTGVNPLSQEMAAGALSIKIGKKPKDLLNPKAIKYMQSIFSIKDTIGKKETREISALCGITVTQVRDYFSSQRSRVRKLVNLSREKASVPEVSSAVSNGCYSSPDRTLLESTEASNNTVDLRIVGECAQVPGNMENITAVYTQVTEHSGNAATQPLVDPGNAPIQLPMNQGNMSTVCTQVVGSSGNVAPVCTQVVGSSGNVAPVCTQVVGYSGNVATVYTQVPGNLWIVSPLGTQFPANLGSFGSVAPQNSADVATVSAHFGVASVVQEGQQNQVKTDLKTVEGGPSNSLKEETTPGVDSDDKRFLENIFNLMRKEQTFSGQMKLMEWVLQIHNSAVLNWFSTKGGITILASWLSQAALEEQTTVLLLLFKVLCHLPLHKALPAQMSAILQTVNRLRFYRTSDISNRARKLLSRWSKMFVRSQALRNPSSRNPSKNTQEITRKDRISEILGDESWQSKIDFPEEILALAGSADDSRKPEPKRTLKLLESADGATRKHGRNVSSSKAKERRKALLVEHPDQKSGGRSVPVARAAPSNHSRPMSADDIQKAKMRAIYMQSKYGKPVANTPQKAKEPKVTLSSQASSSVLPRPRRAEVKTPLKDSPHKIDTSTDPKRNMISPEQSLEKLKGQLQWHTPAEIRIDSSWSVGMGENSKEVQIQTQRNQREKETFYSNPQDIPPNPKEPWDIEMDFDDSLTPEIPIEQAPELDSPASTSAAAAAAADVSEGPPADVEGIPSSSTTGNGHPEPDLELLAVLLKNPDVVFALTSGQGKSLTNEEMVALLDLVKTTGVGLADIANGIANIPKEKPLVPVPVPVPVSVPTPEPEPTSLPSPTPPSNATRVGWRSEFPSSHAQIPQLQHQSTVNRGDTIVSTIASPIPPMAVNHQAQPLGLLHQVPTTMLSLPQNHHRTPQQHQPVPPNLLPLKPHSSYAPPSSQNPNPEIMLHSNHHRYQMNDPSSFPMFLPTPQNPQSHIQPETMTYQPNKIPAWHGATFVGRQTLVPDSRTGRPNELRDGPMYIANHNNYNTSNVYNRRNEMEDSRSPELYQNVLEPRRELGRSQQPEWGREGNSGHHDQYRSGGGGKRSRDRDWDRDRDRDRRR